MQRYIWYLCFNYLLGFIVLYLSYHVYEIFSSNIFTIEIHLLFCFNFARQFKYLTFINIELTSSLLLALPVFREMKKEYLNLLTLLKDSGFVKALLYYLYLYSWFIGITCMWSITFYILRSQFVTFLMHSIWIWNWRKC